MPDLPDELRELLHERAERAPATPAPTDALVRRVRRRRATRATLAVATSVAGVAAVAVAAVAVQPAERAVAPATSQPTPGTSLDTSIGSKYEFCNGPVYLGVYVAVHPTELKFARGCYRVEAGATGIEFDNPQVGTKHDLVITPEGAKEPFYRSAVVDSAGVNAGVVDTMSPIPAGDYSLTCSIHPEMHAQLVVRQAP